MQTTLDKLTPICGIYLLVNTVTGRVYVGQSINVAKRWSTHVENLLSGTHTNKALQKDFAMYGSKCFSAKLIKRCKPEQLLSEESLYIKQYRRLGGVYNGLENPEPR